jgi:hypothetical protein
MLLVLHDDAKGAVADYRRAVELAPLQAAFRGTLAQMLGGLSLHLGGLTVQRNEDDKKVELRGSEDELVEAETNFGLACELDPDNEVLRQSRDTFLDLLQKKTEAK